MRVLELVTSYHEAQIDAARQLLAALARLPQLRMPGANAPLVVTSLKDAGEKVKDAFDKMAAKIESWKSIRE